MTSDELIRFATVIASVTSILVTVLLFFIREVIDARRRRRRAAKILALYAKIVGRFLARNGPGTLPFTMKEVLDAAAEIIQIVEVAALLHAMEDSLFHITLATHAKTSMQRDDRERLQEELERVIAAHERRLGLLSWQARAGLATVAAGETSVSWRHEEAKAIQHND